MKIVIENILTVSMDKKLGIGTYTIEIDNGTIARVTANPVPTARRGEAETRIDGRNLVALPGFINGHIHGDMLLTRGLGDGLTLHQQGENSFLSEKRWFRNELTKEARLLSRLVQYIEALKGGTTFLCDYLFWIDDLDEIVSPFKQLKMDGAIVVDFREDFLTNKPRPYSLLSDFTNHIKEQGLLPLLQGPSEELFEDDLLKSVKETAGKLDVPVQLHLAETKQRTALVEKRFQKTPVEYLYDIGFLDNRTVGSHGVYLSDMDVTLYRKSNATIINSPVSEMKIADGIAPVVKMVKAGIPVGVGTDGALWNDSADMFSEMKTLMLLQRVSNGASSFSAYNAIRAATLGGAEALGIERTYGSIAEGKAASMILLDYVKPHLVPFYHGKNSNVVENIISCGQPSDVNVVIVGGEILVKEGKVLKVSVDEIVKECQELGKALFQELT